MSIVEGLLADRLGGRSGTRGGYKFGRIKREKARVQALHPDLPLLDFGVGEPDRGAAPLAVETLIREAGLPENRLYADNGIAEFQEAAVGYLQRVYGVSGLDPKRHILHGLGSKSILALLPLCFINAGDVVLMPSPGYPILGTHARYLGGEVYDLPLSRVQGFLPDLDAIPPEVLARAKLLYLNYPHNPTGAAATSDFFLKVVEFAHRHGLVVVHDAAYGALTYANPPLSFLSVPGALEVGVEVHSLSKAFSMTGWRMGFLAGNTRVIGAFAAVKDNTDSGQFRAIQKAAAAVLGRPEITAESVQRYSRRLDLLVGALASLGFAATKPTGTFYCYVPIPLGTRSGIRFATAEAFADFLLEHALVSTVPWDEAEPSVRFSVTFEAPTREDEVRVIQELTTRLAGLELVFLKERR